MAHSIESLQRFGLKIFAEPPAALTPRAIVPVFHRWIQTGAVDDLLIDVADYTHLVHGPSVLLIAHEGNYVIDQAGGRPGLAYLRKQPAEGTFAERLASVCRTLLAAGRLLETDAALGDGFVFRGNEIQFVANDRLVAPNAGETRRGLEAALTVFAARLFGGQACTIEAPGASAEPLTLTLTVPEATPVDTLLKRLV